MVEYEEKFIVINRKRFDELNECGDIWTEHPAVLNLESALKLFKEAYECDCDKPMNQKYYVVNQDESYAGRVIQVILTGEMHKEKELKTEQGLKDGE